MNWKDVLKYSQKIHLSSPFAARAEAGRRRQQICLNKKGSGPAGFAAAQKDLLSDSYLSNHSVKPQLM